MPEILFFWIKIMSENKFSLLIDLQKSTCRDYDLPDVEPEKMVAIAMDTLGRYPICGERVVKDNDWEKISWYFYCGDYSEIKDPYRPVHVEHLNDILPDVLKFLRMPYGSGFVLDSDGNEEIWIAKDGGVEIRRLG
jgi:hypothetical protein